MANEYYISAGLVPIDNSTGATSNSYYIAAGLVPNDTAADSGLTFTGTSALGSYADSTAEFLTYAASLTDDLNA